MLGAFLCDRRGWISADMVGQQVAFHAEAVSQDGFAFRAVTVWTGEVEPAAPIRDQRSAGVYHSALFLMTESPADIERGPNGG